MPATVSTMTAPRFGTPRRPDRRTTGTRALRVARQLGGNAVAAVEMAEKLLAWRARHLDRRLTGIELTEGGPVSAGLERRIG